MSGGYIDDPIKRPKGLEEGDHALITIAIKGPVGRAECQKWDNGFNKIKDALKNQIIAITVIGERTPDAILNKNKRQKRKRIKK